ncbi:hypothetical protein G6M89_18980 [Natronolimnobius sp. AArcel1]|uniref:DUF7504 family protein n=1 Tax=Natronolimnobius sp. AArcel1 TaxID=1679093 RepID=UPI0013EDACE7|nr:hypothetical protein [Natronolimnobius sp. AArcel1]NGM71062.1 hypothetical protein [Natronolimnobius sp. AArcel1]
MERDRGSVAVEGAAFARALETLKREGSNVLVVGATPADAHGALCDRLCGSGGDSSAHDHDYGYSGDHSEGYHLFVTASKERARTTAAEGADEGSEPPAAVRSIEFADAAGDDDVPIETLGSEIIDTIGDLEADADGFEPAELRVCVDSLVTLFQDHDAETVFRLLHITTSGVDHVNGMGHYHLALNRDHEAVSLLEPLFDAVVEVRTSGGAYEQRWHLREQGSTAWIPL